MPDQSLQSALARQFSWLQSWKSTSGDYQGYVVHRSDLKRMFRIHGTPWSQGPIMKGYLNLFEKTGNDRWIREATLAADSQCTRLDKTGKYLYAGFEDDRFSSSVHNSLANSALLDVANVLNFKQRHKEAQRYIDVAKTNIDKYILGTLWDDEFGAFRFSTTDYYSPQKTRFVANMNSVAIESLFKLFNLTGDELYRRHAIETGEWLLTQSVKSPGLGGGGIRYSHNQPNIHIAIYTALAMRGLENLYSLTKDGRYTQMMQRAASHLMGLLDPDTKLFYHAVVDGELIKYPQFIAGSGIILKALDDAARLTGAKYALHETLEAILSYQLPNGGFPSFIGYDTPENGRMKGRGREVWEDKVPVIGWNAHLFEFLTRIVADRFSCKEQKISTNCFITSNYSYLEGRRYIFILGTKPVRGLTLYLATKRFPVALIYVSVPSFRRYVTSYLKH